MLCAICTVGAVGGTPIMLVHGWPEFSGTRRKILPALTEHKDVVAPGLRGFRRSSKPARVTALQTYAEDLVAIADHLSRRLAGCLDRPVRLGRA